MIDKDSDGASDLCLFVITSKDSVYVGEFFLATSTWYEQDCLEQQSKVVDDPKPHDLS